VLCAPPPPAAWFAAPSSSVHPSSAHTAQHPTQCVARDESMET
jgi:hypothetical protein